jgi:hypothetical protein
MPSFHRRKNFDGSWDSICKDCYLTVFSDSRARTEAELEQHEIQLECFKSRNDEDIANRGQGTRNPIGQEGKHTETQPRMDDILSADKAI